MNITGFGRASLEVRDLKTSERFYSKVLRMPAAAEAGREAEIGFKVGESYRFVVKAAAPSASANGSPIDESQAAPFGTHHIAFVIGNNPRALEAAAAHLSAQGVAFQQVSHEEYESIYLRDPDGHLIELYYWPEW